MSKHSKLSLGAVAGLSLIASVVSAVSMVQGPAHATSSVGGNVGVSWSIAGAPSTGLTDLTFPIAVHRSTAHARGTYFAQQFGFTHAPDVGYTGLQPRQDRNGHERLRGVFSSFIAGTTSTDPNCSDGADGGAGVSCAAGFDATYGHTYQLRVTRSGVDTWTGTAVDRVTGRRTHLGTYRLPRGSGNLQARQLGFVEYYLGWPSCSVLPHVDVTFGGPTTTNAGGLRGTSVSQGEYGDCVGRADYAARRVGRGVNITRGR